MTLLRFPEFTPDLPDYDNPGTVLAKNVMPGGISYKPFPDFVNFSASPTAINKTVLGAVSTRNPESGVSLNFAGDANDLYLLNSDTFQIVSKVTGGYTTDPSEKWNFTVFGTHVIATNFFDSIQTYDTSISTLFADLSAAAPKARYIATVRDFVVVGNTNDGVDGFVPNRVRWSGIGDSTSWTVSATTMADYQDLDTNYGWITQVVGGDYGLIFQERAIIRMNFVGSPVVFDFITVDRENGTQYPGSVAAYGSLTFFIALDGFKVFDGSRTTSIGASKVDNFFFNDLDATHAFNIVTTIDYVNHLVMWVYPGLQNVNGAANHILIYNFSPNAVMKWAYVDLSTSSNTTIADGGIEYVFSSITGGYTLDQLDQWEIDHGLAANIDVLSYSLDSRIWDGNTITFGFFTTDHILAYPGSDFLGASIETAETQLNEGQRTDVFRIKPYVDSISTTPTTTSTAVQIGTRNTFSEAVTYGSPIFLDVNGEVQCMSNARYHRVRVNIASGFSHAIGIEILESKPAGYR